MQACITEECAAACPAAVCVPPPAQGDGAWEPKAGKSDGKSRRTKTHRSSSAAAATATAAGDGAAAADSDTEQLARRQQRRQVLQQRHKKQKQPHRRAAAAAAAGSLKQEPDGRADGTVSERDTTSADQQGEAADDGDAVGPSAVEQGEVDSGMQLDEQCKKEDTDAVEEKAAEQDCAAQLAQAEATDIDVDQQEDLQAGADGLQQEADAVCDDQKQQQEQELQADEQPERPTAEQCNRAALIRSGSSRVAEAADAAAAAAAEVDAAAAVKPEALEASAADAAAAPVDASAAAAVVPTDEAPADAGQPAVGKGKPSTAPLLVGHTHEEMVVAAAAAVAVAAPPAPRGRAARGARGNGARSNGDGASEGVTKRGGRGGRGGRGAAAAAAAQAAAAAEAAAKEQQAKQEQEQQAQQVQQPAASGSASGSGQLPANLRVEPGRALKHSGSSEGPLSPTSPSGGSPRVNRCDYKECAVMKALLVHGFVWHSLHIKLPSVSSCAFYVSMPCSDRCGQGTAVWFQKAWVWCKACC